MPGGIWAGSKEVMIASKGMKAKVRGYVSDRL